MSITRIFIENFKGIGSMVEIPIRPVTLLFGANSAGKSTVLQALLYLREVLGNGNLDADGVGGGGEAINLGGFLQMVHRHDPSRVMRIGVEIKYNPLLDFDEQPMAYTLIYGLNTDQLSKSVQVCSVEVRLNGRKFLAVQGATNYQYKLVYWDVAHPGVAAWLTRPTSNFLGFFQPNAEGTSTAKSQIECLLEYIHAYDSNKGGKLPEVLIPVDGHPLSVLSLFRASFVPEEDARWFPTTEKEMEENAASTFFSDFVDSAKKEVISILQTIRYIGPIRMIPGRGFTPPRSPRPEQWSDGLAAWDLLHSEAGLEGGEDFVAKISHYMASPDRLNLGLKLTVAKRIDVQADGLALRRLAALGANPEMSDSSSELAQAIAEISALPVRHQLALATVAGGIEVEPLDVGTGVSQVLPVLVAAACWREPDYRSIKHGGPDHAAGDITLIEQPELHTHPAVQCALGDLFIREAKANPGRLFLLETHSEHLMLRLLRRVRETTENELPADAPACTPEDISVIYVESTKNGVVLTGLPVTGSGDFSRPWPKGFFEERVEELF